jgi:hypothetical protein
MAVNDLHNPRLGRKLDPNRAAVRGPGHPPARDPDPLLCFLQRKASTIRENETVLTVGWRIMSDHVCLGDVAGAPLALTALFCA